YCHISFGDCEGPLWVFESLVRGSVERIEIALPKLHVKSRLAASFTTGVSWPPISHKTKTAGLFPAGRVGHPPLRVHREHYHVIDQAGLSHERRYRYQRAVGEVINRIEGLRINNLKVVEAHGW